MKLKIQFAKAEPRIEKLKLEPHTVELLDAYQSYHQQRINQSISTEYLLTEMINTFMKSDREFMRWYRNQNQEHIQRYKQRGKPHGTNTE